DLLAEPLLNGEAACIEAHEPRQLGDAQDLLACDVADVRGAVERQRVVLAEREEGDRAFHDLTVRSLDSGGPLRRKRGAELGVAVVAGGRIEERLEKPQ